MNLLVIFVINGLAVWRLTHLVNKESGPWDVFAKIRDSVGIVFDEYGHRKSGNVLGQMINCFWCLAIWMAILVEFIGSDGFYFNRILATSAIAILIEMTLLKRDK